MREFKATDCPFGKSYGTQATNVAMPYNYSFYFLLNSRVFRIAIFKIPKCLEVFVITFNIYKIVNKEYGILCMFVCVHVS